MKKIMTFTTAVALSAVVFGQSMFHLGPNLSQLKGANSNSDYSLGYQVGISSNFGEFLSLEPGLFLINKGGKHGDVTTNLNYIQIPIEVKVNFRIDDVRIYFGAGVYGALGIWGNTKNNGKKITSINFFEDEASHKMFDFGGQISGGIMFGRLGITLGYQPGLMNIHKNIDTRNNTFFLNLSYVLSHYRHQ